MDGARESKSEGGSSSKIKIGRGKVGGDKKLKGKKEEKELKEEGERERREKRQLLVMMTWNDV